jgi:hypothetical protein
VNSEKSVDMGIICLLLIDSREVKTRPTYECRCDERLKPEGEESTCLVYIGLLGELEHLTIETRLILGFFCFFAHESFYFNVGHENF